VDFRRFRDFCRAHAGAAAIEFALVVPVFMLRAFGIEMFSACSTIHDAPATGCRGGPHFGRGLKRN